MTLTSNVLAYLDPLGSLDLAHQDVERFARALSQFQAAVQAAQGDLGEDDQIILLHNRAYVEAHDPGKLFKFIRRVRKELLIQGYYIRGAISTGTLTPDQVDDGRVKGFILNGQSAAEVYALQEDVKGIGIFVDAEVATSYPTEVVRTCYLQNTRGSTRSFTVVDFWDVRLGDNERTQKVLLRLQQNLYRTWTRSSHRVSRYFITLLIAWIRSENYSSLNAIGPKQAETADDTSKTKSKKNTVSRALKQKDYLKSYTFDVNSLTPISRIIVRKDIDNYRGVPGIELVSLAFVDQVISQAKADVVSSAAIAFLAQQKPLMRNLGLIHDVILNRATREVIAEFLASHNDSSNREQDHS